MRQIDADKLIEHLNDIYLGSAPAPGMSDAERQSAIDFCNGLQEAMEVAAQYAADCYLLTLEDLKALPEGAIVWEEVRIDWEKIEMKTPEDKGVEITIAPVVKRGDQLMDNSCTTDIDADMFGNPERGDQMRYWSNCPTDEEREATAWRS